MKTMDKQEPLFEVIKKTHGEPDELIFRGSIEECKHVEDEMSEYYYYDLSVTIETIPVKVPIYSSFEKFLTEVKHVNKEKK